MSVHQLSPVMSMPAKLDEPSGHPLGMGLTFLLLGIFFVVVFAAMVYIGGKREKRRGPRPAPQYPILGKPKKD